MAPGLTIPGLEPSTSHERRARRAPAAAPASGPRPALLERLLGEREGVSAEPPAAPVDTISSRRGGEGTLDDLLVGAWEDLTAHRASACPVCKAAMTPRYGAGAAPVGGRCGDCHTSLA